jgi:2-dehydrotetronate isomerase
MPRFAANLTMMFTEAAMLSRPRHAQASGFDGVEVLFPYDHTAKEWEAALAGMPLALINAPPGDWVAGERGHAAVPGGEARFRTSFLKAADLATRLGAARVHVMAGIARGPLAEQTYCENLGWAAAQAPDVQLTIEPLNPVDMPGYFLNDFDQAGRLIDDMAIPNLGLQFDLWHAARLHGDASAVWARHRTRVNHVQIAGLASRAEPGGGGFDLTGLCAGLDAMGYDGWVAAEYRPAKTTVQGLAWLGALKSRSQLIGG